MVFGVLIVTINRVAIALLISAIFDKKAAYIIATCNCRMSNTFLWSSKGEAISVKKTCLKIGTNFSNCDDRSS